MPSEEATNKRTPGMRFKGLLLYVLRPLRLRSEDWWKRGQAVRKLKNQALLFEIAIRDANSLVRGYAMEALTDRRLLAEVAKTRSDCAYDALELLQDQILLEEVVKEVSPYHSRFLAIRRLEQISPGALWNMEVRALWTERCCQMGTSGTAVDTDELSEDQHFLASAATTAPDWLVRAGAARLLRDKRLLAEIAQGDRDPDVRRAAVEELDDQEVLVKVAIADEEGSVFCAAIEKIEDQGLLAEIAIGDSRSDARKVAIRHLRDLALVRKIVFEEKDPNVRIFAVMRLEDQDVLAKVALCDSDQWVRSRAVGKLEDEGTLARIAVTDREVFVRQEAREKLGSKADAAIRAFKSAERMDLQKSIVLRCDFCDAPLKYGEGGITNSNLFQGYTSGGRSATAQAMMASGADYAILSRRQCLGCVPCLRTRGASDSQISLARAAARVWWAARLDGKDVIITPRMIH